MKIEVELRKKNRQVLVIIKLKARLKLLRKKEKLFVKTEKI
jgi:hypothetical protein